MDSKKDCTGNCSRHASNQVEIRDVTSSLRKQNDASFNASVNQRVLFVPEKLKVFDDWGWDKQMMLALDDLINASQGEKKLMRNTPAT